MTNLLLPDLFAMMVLLSVLWLVHRRYPQQNIRLWISGLLLILLECIARILYASPMAVGPHRTLHSVALDAYLLAGMLFLRSSLAGLQRLPRANVYSVLYTAPCLVLMTEYGCDVKSRTVYVVTALAGIAVTEASSLILHRPKRYQAVLIAMWLPTTYAALLQTPRLAVYLLLATVYLATACAFFWSLPKTSSGKLAVVTGFVVWGACFATHPWIAAFHPGWANLASEIWNMQKFLITVGFLLVLFERQVESNEWLALHDQLTGLPNRRLFQDRITSAIARAERDRTALILFYVDLNRFKEVNDTLGHDAGDALLCQVAESLQHVVRRTDTLARMGGDEFVLLATDMRTERSLRKERRWIRMREAAANHAGEETLPDWKKSIADISQHALIGGADTGMEEAADKDGNSRMVHQATRIEQTIRAAIDKPVQLRSPTGMSTVQVSASVGVAVYPVDSTDPEELFRIADQRMYDDKSREPEPHGNPERVRTLWATLEA